MNPHGPGAKGRVLVLQDIAFVSGMGVIQSRSNMGPNSENTVQENGTKVNVRRSVAGAFCFTFALIANR